MALQLEQKIELGNKYRDAMTGLVWEVYSTRLGLVRLFRVHGNMYKFEEHAYDRFRANFEEVK